MFVIKWVFILFWPRMSFIFYARCQELGKCSMKTMKGQAYLTLTPADSELRVLCWCLQNPGVTNLTVLPFTKLGNLTEPAVAKHTLTLLNIASKLTLTFAELWIYSYSHILLEAARKPLYDGEVNISKSNSLCYTRRGNHKWTYNS